MKITKATTTTATLFVLIGGALALQQAATSGSAPPPAQSTTTTTTTTTTTASPKKATGVKRSTAPKIATSKPAKPPKPPWQEFKLNPKSTLFLDFTDTNPDLILSIFSRTSGITILKDPSFKTPLTVTSAKPVKLDEAFEILNTVLELNQFELQKKGRLMVVAKKSAAPPPQMPPSMPPPQPATPPAPAEDDKPVLQVYRLQRASASQVARVVNEVFSQQQLEQIVQQLQSGGGFNPNQGNQFGRPQGPQPPKIVRASSEDYSNSVVVNAPQKYQVEVKKLIDELDKSTDKPLDSQIFKLNYVSADDVVDAIQNILDANAPTGRGSGKKDQDQNPYGFYIYRGYGSSSSKSSTQTVVAIKQTNSVIVSATPENMILVKKLIEEIDKDTPFVGTTTVIHLENAKATDVATLLNNAFTRRRDTSQQDNPYFFIYSDMYSPKKTNDQPTDHDEDGKLVNVRDLTGKVNIIADPNTNSLIVVTLPSNLKLIRKVIEQIDEISPQVMIETIIVEANLDKTTKLGVEWSFLQNKVLNNSHTTATGGTNFGVQSSSPEGFKYTLSGTDYAAFVNALETDTRFKVLSTPRIFTSNNVKAEIDVSQKLPYIGNEQAVTTGGLLANTEYVDVGVILTVTPRITGSGEVSMDVDQKADDLQGYTSWTPPAPIINHREATTTASVKDGETIVLGGIIRTSVNLTSNKVPLLGDIPLLGNLFRSTSHETTKTELLVLLTPHVVRNAAEARRLREQQTNILSKASQDAIKKYLEENKESVKVKVGEQKP